MYKIILTHRVIPGKLPELIRWCSNADKERKVANPEYVPPKRYITVFGDLTRFMAEFPVEVVPEHPPVWGAGDGTGGVGDMIVPGRSEMYVLKEIEIDS